MGPLGRWMILGSLLVAAMGAVSGMQAGRTGSSKGLQRTRQLAWAYVILMVGANLVMEGALFARDYTVRYVDQVGSTEIPDWVVVVSLWSALEGSILFWGAILSAFLSMFLIWSKKFEPDLIPYSLGTILMVGAFFSFLIAGPADPFGTVLPRAMHTGPNPQLQNHILMVIHPPMLYLGYVGMTIPFAMGVASLLRGRLSAGWMRPLRRWMLLPWGFLTVGIVLGSWWAYEVLGWGGYWAWDPVENASFIPWLTASGFLHAAMLQERRGILKGWSLVLLLSTFALTILGTFMTRSGVFNSVHSFTQSAIGPTFLVFLAIVCAASIVLIGLRLHLLEPEGEIKSTASREAMFIVNNFLFVGFTLAVLIGTVFPLLAEAFTGTKLSVGEPYFNMFAVPLGIALVFMMGVGPALPWGRATPQEAVRAVRVPMIVAVVLAVVAGIAGAHNPWVIAIWFVSAFATTVAVRDMIQPIAAVHRRHGGSWGSAAVSAFARGRRRYGGQIVHIGVAMMAVALGVSWTYQQVHEVVLRSGEPQVIDDYELAFTGRSAWSEPHRDVVAATVEVRRDGELIEVLTPRMNRYQGSMAPQGTPAVRTTFAEDLYLSAMQIDDAGQFVAMRVFINPMIVWLWLAALVMGLGCAVAAWPERRREASVLAGPGPVSAEAAA